MTDDRHDYRCKVTLLLDDVTEEQAKAFLVEGAEVDQRVRGLYHSAMIENPGKIEKQP